jgi:hypothetical protein
MNVPGKSERLTMPCSRQSRMMFTPLLSWLKNVAYHHGIYCGSLTGMTSHYFSPMAIGRFI